MDRFVINLNNAFCCYAWTDDETMRRTIDSFVKLQTDIGGNQVSILLHDRVLEINCNHGFGAGDFWDICEENNIRIEHP